MQSGLGNNIPCCTGHIGDYILFSKATLRCIQVYRTVTVKQRVSIAVEGAHTSLNGVLYSVFQRLYASLLLFLNILRLVGLL